MNQLNCQYLRNFAGRTIIFTIIALLFNAFIGIGKLLLGFYLDSIWLITNAVYYLLLFGARANILRNYSKVRKMENEKERYKLEFSVYRKNGYLLCLLSMIYFGICLRMYLFGESTVVKGSIFVFMFAVISFLKLGFGVYGVILTKKRNNPLFSSLKALNYADALVSIVITQCALLYMKDIANTEKYSAMTGMIFSLFILVAGIVKIIRKEKGSYNSIQMS